MRRYLYDGSFPGLLTVLHILIEEETEPENIVVDGKERQESLFGSDVYVDADAERVEDMSSGICRRMGDRALRRLFHAFLSDEEGREYGIYRCVSLGWEMGKGVEALAGDEHVSTVMRLSRATGREAHRMCGFLRFRELEGGVYYAPMETACDVLCLVAPYFTRRMGGQDWIIHDLGREQAALFIERRLSLCGLPAFAPNLSPSEHAYQGMWKDYFKTIAVEGRTNPRLQKSLMPAKFWNMLVEEPGHR
ncbi:MAG: TIGR03915 family putative DNA repair protein [Actinomycetota bacterium]|nr:TIGR03915 family putative DNA repair protein [Actinomycetota bacterium]